MTIVDWMVWEERYELAFSRVKEIKTEDWGADCPVQIRQFFADAAAAVLDPAEKMPVAPEGAYKSVLTVLEKELEFLRIIGEQALLWEKVIRLELFLEVYSAFFYEWSDAKALPVPETIRQTLYWFAFDYSDMAAERYVECLGKDTLQEVAGAKGASVLYDQQIVGDREAEAEERICCLLDKAYIVRRTEVIRTALERGGWKEAAQNAVCGKAEGEDSRGKDAVNGAYPGRGKKKLWWEYLQQMSDIFEKYTLG